jgi:hypothetical protein
MSVEAVVMYRLRCDTCNLDSCADTDYWCWAEDSQAIDMARESEWLITDDGEHYCPDCVTWDEEKDELVPIKNMADLP